MVFLILKLWRPIDKSATSFQLFLYFKDLEFFFKPGDLSLISGDFSSSIRLIGLLTLEVFPFLCFFFGNMVFSKLSISNESLIIFLFFSWWVWTENLEVLSILNSWFESLNVTSSSWSCYSWSYSAIGIKNNGFISLLYRTTLELFYFKFLIFLYTLLGISREWSADYIDLTGSFPVILVYSYTFIMLTIFEVIWSGGLKANS